MDRRPRHRLVASRRPLRSALVALGVAAAAALLVSVTAAVFSSTFSNPASSLTAVSLDAYIPASVSASRVDASTCRVTWTASATPGAPAGLTYDVTDGTTTLASDVAALTVDLSTGADVTVRVLARAGTWVSASSRTAAGGCGGPPSAPTGLAATAGDQQVAATWNAATANGTPVTGYTLAATPTDPATGTATGAASTCTASNPAAGCTVTGLTNGWTYVLTVTAASAWGASPASPAATAIPYPAAVMSAANLRLWLDGADTGTMTQDSAGTTAVTGAGQPVGRWTDKSGQTDASGVNSADQSTAVARPSTTLVNGRPVPGFDGGNDWLGLRAPALLPSGTTPSTEVVVAALTDPAPNSSTYRTAFKHGTNTTNQSRSFYKGSSSAALTIDTHGANALVSGTWSATSQVVVGQFSTTELALRVSGRPAATLTPSAGVTTSTASATVGNSPSFFWQGPIPEVVVFTGTLTPTQIRTVEEYLARKWATSMTPSAPTSVGATPGNAGAAVTWAAPSWNGGSPVTGYTATASPGGATCTASGAAATGCTITGLTNGTGYSITVTATNAVGTGPASGPASATPRTVPGAPTGVTATPGAGQATVSWTAPASNGGSAVTGYTATATPAGGGSSLSCSSAGTSCTITGLTNGISYTVTVTASNAAGAGPASSGVTTTPADYAAQVTATPGLVGYWKLADGPGSSTAADSSGQNHPGTVITGVTFGNGSRPMPADPSTTAAFAAGVGSGISVGDPGGVGGVYDFAGRASFSVAGWVHANAPAYGYAYPDLLYKKRYLSQSDQEGWHVYLDDTQATSWSPGWIGFARFSAAAYSGVTAPLPLSTWTHVVATYDGTTMRLYFNGELVASGTSTSSVIDTAQALVIGRHWENLLAHVSVWNVALTPTQVTTLYTQTGSPVAATAPQAPRSISATAGTSQATVSWSAPAYSGLSPVTSYTATASPGGATCTTTGSPPATGCTITGLTGGTTYSVTVTATNAVGTGPASTSVSVTPPTAPGAPTAVTLTPSESQLAASWTAPASNGGSTVTGYTATATATGFTTRTCTAAGSPPAPGCTITGLTNGVSYAVSVTATNAVGTGSASASATAVPYPSTIMTPARMRLWLDGADTTSLFQDTAGTTPATTAGHGVARWSDKSGQAGHALQSTAGNRPTLTTLNGRLVPGFNGTTSFLSADPTKLPTGTTSSASFVAAKLTGDFSAWGIGLIWGNESTGAARSHFVKPDGSVCLDGYSATQACGGVAGMGDSLVMAGQVTGTGVSFGLNGAPQVASPSGALSTGTGFARVGSRVGVSFWPGPIPEVLVLTGTVTPAERRTVEEYLARKWATTITPQAPTGVTAVRGSGQATVGWTVPGWDGGSAITGYTATASPGGATCTASGAAATGCTLTGLTNGTAYTITVTATNAAGTGPASSSASVTPAAFTSVLTLTGSATSGYLDAPVATARFGGLNGVAVSSTGTIYVADTTNHRIRAISGGTVTTLAGSGSAAYADGTGTAASFRSPTGLAIDSSGNLYVGDTANHRIRKVTPAGVVTTIAGSGTSGSSDNGTGTSARFNQPTGVALNPAQTVLYVSDTNNSRIRTVTLASTAVATLAGSSSGYLDATGTSARFNKQQGIEVGPSGDVYVADTLNHRIRKVTAAGVVTTVAGAGAGSADGVGTAATFDEPSDVTLDGSGFLYVADNTNNLLRRIDLGTGTVTTLVGSGTAASTDGNGTLAAFDDPTSLTYDGANAAIWVVEGVGHRVRKVY